MAGLSIVWIIAITVLNHSNRIAKDHFKQLSTMAVHEKLQALLQTQRWVWLWSTLPNITLDAVTHTEQGVT